MSGITNYSQLSHLVGYLNSWSGVQHYIRQNSENPINLIEKDLEKAWGKPTTRELKFPLHIRLGKV